jgi:predicted patatin/cPLA2 family phospholipase
MDYSPAPAPYNLARLDALTHPDTLQKDKQEVLQILDRWHAKFPEESKPKLVLVAASGGGQRAALWTLKVLQELHTTTSGKLTQHSMLYTGASGGVLGEAFFRELYLRSLSDPALDLANPDYLHQLAADNLNPILFSLLVNDLLFPTQKLEYEGRVYSKDRGFAFEEQLNKNTKGILDKSLADYKDPERLGQIPLLPLTTLITNDGRKLVISPHSFSFFGSAGIPGSHHKELKQSIDFMRFFAAHDPGNLRFLTALRMSATFPFVTPNVELPSIAVLQTMDTGLSDNFGIQDALRFLYVFQEWIGANTSGVVLVTIRDSEKSPEISSSASTKILEKIGSPLKSIYGNWDKMQTIHNEVLFNYMAASMPFGVEKIEFEYAPGKLSAAQTSEISGSMQRASLNWRLTAKEKRSILATIQTQSNQKALARAKEIFEK